ncbi:hypothetical protein [Streptomyces ortus]|uniref:Uncharacterized protein n=1 Tax=Streptomyces ortus TaxID=2867268 RepID=A0ABT3V0F4_9ACTN|nr:hypothetical protein [Streptomyces ortus]MCX4232110.1 hypothetical protein [Streptomyces ortus]
MNAAEFNARYPVGTPVFAYPGARPEDIPSTRRLVTRTRTVATTSASGDPVVWVDGEGSYICLTHVDPVSESEWQAAAPEAARKRISDLLWWSVPSSNDTDAKAKTEALLDAFAAAVRDAAFREAVDLVAADTDIHIRYGSATDYAERHADLLRRKAGEGR